MLVYLDEGQSCFKTTKEKDTLLSTNLEFGINQKKPIMLERESAEQFLKHLKISGISSTACILPWKQMPILWQLNSTGLPLIFLVLLLLAGLLGSNCSTFLLNMFLEPNIWLQMLFFDNQQQIRNQKHNNTTQTLMILSKLSLVISKLMSLQQMLIKISCCLRFSMNLILMSLSNWPYTSLYCNSCEE